MNDNSFQKGVLESWTAGALRFDGKATYCVLPHDRMRRDYRWGPTRRGRQGAYEGRERLTLDMAAGNFLIEAVFRTEPGHAGGVIASKGGATGYALAVDAAGRPCLTLRAGGATWSRAATAAVNDGAWHHVVAEADRRAGALRVYVDGALSEGPADGSLPGGASVSNEADFLVGRDAAGNHFRGLLDFLRVSRGTLADAETTITELYAWEFDGPFLKDFLGRPVAGERRDAGALERANR